MKHAYKALVILIGGTILVNSVAAIAANSTPFNLTTSPVTVDLAGSPGTTVSTTISVRNNNPVPAHLVMSVQKFSAYGEQGKALIGGGTASDDYLKWVSFSPQQFDAAPNEWKDVIVTIAMPKTAAFGYYYAVEVSRAGDTAAVPGKQVFAGSNVVFMLLEAKVPSAVKRLDIVSIQATHNIYEYLPAEFNINVRNSGNIHAFPVGNVVIYRGKNQIDTLDVNKAHGNILPKTNRTFTASWKSGFPVYQPKMNGDSQVLDKAGKPVSVLKWDFSQLTKFRIGRYTASVVMAYNDGNGHDFPLTANVSFWVIPWRIIGLFLLIFVFTPIGFYVTVHRFLLRIKKRR